MSSFSFFLTTWPKKRAPEKTIKMGGGVQPDIFWKTVMCHETAIFGQKTQESVSKPWFEIRDEAEVKLR